MDLGLKGKRALVMGASRGLGRAIAAAIAAEGADLLLAARNRDRLAQDAKALSEAHGIRAEAVSLDLASDESVDSLIAAAHGTIDVLLANGGGPPPTGALGVEPALWKANFQTMVYSQIRIIDALVPPMRKRKWGRVIAIASSGVVKPIPTLAISNTLRASLVTFCKTLATEVAADGVTVNVVLPGRIATERVASLDENASRTGDIPIAEVQSRFMSAIPMKRYGKPEEFAAVVAFLAGRGASYVTGSMIRIDGGMITTV